MKLENTILQNATLIIEQQTGISIDYKKNEEKDFLINIETHSGKKIGEYLADVRPRINNAMIGEMSLKNKNSEENLILITEYVTQPQTEKLRELGISFFDTAGNAYLNRGDLYIFVSGKKTETKKQKTLSIFRPAGVKFLLAAINKKGLENADYRTIADDVGISKTAVGNLMNDLEKAGYLIKRGNSERILTKKKELITRWVLYYSEDFRHKLKPVKYHSTKYKGRWWDDINIDEYNAVWGGETGGAILTKHLKPETATIYANSTLSRLQLKYGLVRDKRGEIDIVQKFWKFGEVGNVAPPLVVYAELLATADERNIETAQIVYDKYIAQNTEENS